MKARTIILGVGICLSIVAIVLVLLSGDSVDKADFGSLAETGESLLYHVSKTGQIVTSVSAEKEVDIGDGIHEKILERRIAKNIQGTPVYEYVNAVGARVASSVKRKEIPYRFHILDTQFPNAFASCGGHVYITIGLLEKINTEAELASILGHEITHIDAKHAIGRIQHRVVMEKMRGDDIRPYVHYGIDAIFQQGYSEAQEYEADKGGVYLAYSAGYHPEAYITVLEDVGVRTKRKNGSLTPVGDTITATFGIMGRYFATHPAGEERIGKVERYIEEKGFLRDDVKFYVGQRNYEEKIPYEQKKYVEELLSEYVGRDEDNEEIHQKPVNEDTLSEVFTVYGKIYKGMRREDLKELLPEKSKAFERKERIGYKDVMIYTSKADELKEKVNLWIELKDERVDNIKVYGQE